MSLDQDMLDTLYGSEALKDFAKSATLVIGTSTSSAVCYLDKGFMESAFGAVGVENAAPQIHLKDSDCVGVVHGSLVTVSGITYKVIEVRPDGCGETTLILSED